MESEKLLKELEKEVKIRGEERELIEAIYNNLPNTPIGIKIKIAREIVENFKKLDKFYKERGEKDENN